MNNEVVVLYIRYMQGANKIKESKDIKKYSMNFSRLFSLFKFKIIDVKNTDIKDIKYIVDDILIDNASSEDRSSRETKNPVASINVTILSIKQKNKRKQESLFRCNKNIIKGNKKANERGNKYEISNTNEIPNSLQI